VALRAERVAVFESIVGERLAEVNAGVLGGHNRVPVNLVGAIKDQPREQVKLRVSEALLQDRKDTRKINFDEFDDGDKQEATQQAANQPGKA
jgi:hypothetical protein